jgi:hypothetical protein
MPLLDAQKCDLKQHLPAQYRESFMKAFIASLESVPGKGMKDYRIHPKKPVARSWATKPLAEGLVSQIEIGGGTIPITMPSGERGTATNFRVEPREDRFVIACEVETSSARIPTTF